MAYNPTLLGLLTRGIRFVGNQRTAIWEYYSPVDSLAVVAVAGYISDAVQIGMLIGDLVNVYDAINDAEGIYFVSSFTGYAANLSIVSVGGSGGGGDVTTQVAITTGTTGPLAALNSIMKWESPDVGAKTQPIPAPTGSLAVIEIADYQGTAELYPITAVPASGSIIGGQGVIGTNFGSIRLRDTTEGWVNV